MNQATVIVPQKYYRCNDSFESDEHTPPELRLPSDYSLRTTHGVGLYLRSALSAAWTLGQTPGFNSSIPSGPIDHENYWFLYESASMEGAEGVNYLKLRIQEQLHSDYLASQSAYNATYAITLVYILILFGVIFANLKQDLVNESKHNRGRKFFRVSCR
jgi:hypothetical protein